MFKRSAPSSQPDLFSGFDSHISDRKRRQLNDANAWHNLVYRHITSQIDESRFAVLFDPQLGRPNAPIRQLVTMMILKEGFGWSDEQLFDACRFNILVMRALGLSNLGDEVPTESTYYLFKQSLYAHQRANGQDLIGQTFADLTKAQAELFGVSGERIRMDSKLIGSNIATCCRLQLILSCVQAFWQSLSEIAQRRMSEGDRQALEALCGKKPQQVVYRLSAEEKRAKLEEVGLLLFRLIETFGEDDSDRYGLIRRVFEEQYTVSEKQVLPRQPQDIPTSSLQSVQDEDAVFRRKKDQHVKGYSANLTETCNETGVNLITDVLIVPATTGDADLVQPAIAHTQEIVGTVKEVSMDGGYQSPDNWTYAQSQGKQFHYTGLGGERGRFLYERTAEGGVEAIDLRTGEVLEIVEYKPGKYRFFVDGKPYYINEQDIENSYRRTQVEQLPDAIRHRRNNVEASLFQLSYHTRNNKTRYRGLVAHRCWAFCRAAWMNLVRIKNYVIQPEKFVQSMAMDAKKAVLGLSFLCKTVRQAFTGALEAIGFRKTPKRRCWLGSCCLV